MPPTSGRRKTQAVRPNNDEEDTASISVAPTGPSMLQGTMSMQTLTPQQVEVVMDMLDQLREGGVEKDVALPGFVAAGDTSAGKSATLERLVGIPFPGGTGVVTTFATTVTMRPAKEERVHVTIVPGDKRTEAAAAELRKFHREIRSPAEYGKVYNEATQAMSKHQKSTTLHDDRLHVDVRGPGRSPLSVIDLPGLIHAPFGNVTGLDQKLSHEIVKKYISGPRTIVLAIISAANDVANQAITSYTREVDPEGKRTMGIITKPDSVKKHSENESSWIQLAQNDLIPLDLGWHVLVNKIDKNTTATPAEVDGNESKYFSHDRFEGISEQQLGLASLRPRLEEIASEQLIAVLPEVEREIDMKLAKTEAKEAELGFCRTNKRERRAFIAELSNSFRQKALAAVEGSYADRVQRLTGQNDEKLLSKVRIANDGFAANMRLYGATLRIEGALNVEDAKSSPQSSAASEYDTFRSEGKASTRKDALVWVKGKVNECRGSELPGATNSGVAKELFWQLASKWENFATTHVEKVFQLCKKFADTLLTTVLGKGAADPKGRIKTTYIDRKLQAAKQEALKRVERFVEAQNTALYTYDYASNQRARNSFYLDAIRGNNGNTPPYTAHEQQAVEALDQAMAIYYVRLNYFVEAVNLEAVEQEMVFIIPNLLADITRQTDEELEGLAAESPKNQRKRLEIEASRKRLMDAKGKFQECLGGLY
ncbi:hypothetical protein LTR78_006092 [Recurvomyces mirabilis]|uniref:Dynamin-type G domain-containing protein n=1 Tax=Recurvomyces mirabilis TaxID=574656 RepID=A0AAE0WLG8_9PEZI|nr:hypothetical protein LTR78_006092 [Recurvomyces mirabilis]KAK5151935.1 hypothetical protein LTS14_008709 [Recurvomyces mirabilis]